MEKFLEQLKNNWVILSFIAYLIVSSTSDKLAIVQAKNDIEKLSVVVEKIQNIEVSVAVIQEKITSIEKILK